jgi:hypothetical protein
MTSTRLYIAPSSVHVDEFVDTVNMTSTQLYIAPSSVHVEEFVDTVNMTSTEGGIQLCIAANCKKLWLWAAVGSYKVSHCNEHGDMQNCRSQI